VSNTLLQGIYGGHWVPHVRDHGAWTSNAESLAADAAPRVLFGGAPRGHKGLPTLIAAWNLIRHRTAVLHLAVPDPDDEFLKGVLKTANDQSRVRVTAHGFDEMPRVVGSAAVVVIPQDNARGAVGQLPAKLLDAMAAGRPIVATDVGDTVRWLPDGAGLVVSPGSPAALADGIDYLLAHPDEAAAMGARAREHFKALGSEQAVRPRLTALVKAVIDRTPLPPVVPAFSLAAL
jgi:glycosyltransferase involved in cell wall biosynthesis